MSQNINLVSDRARCLDVIQTVLVEAGKMAKWLKVLAENLSLIPRNNMAAPVPENATSSSCFQRHQAGAWHMYTHAGITLTVMK